MYNPAHQNAAKIVTISQEIIVQIDVQSILWMLIDHVREHK